MAGLSDAAFQRLLAIINSDDVVHVPVGADAFAVIDAADASIVEPYRWKRTGQYAVTRIDGVTVPMHRLILAPPAEMFVDHEDGDGLNNQRYNLRVCTHQQNMCNRTSASGQSRFKGVYRDRDSWRAEIRANGKKFRLGSFTSEVKAARAYDKAALKYHGEFAKTNEALGLLSN